jgi:hypothetical protein
VKGRDRIPCPLKRPSSCGYRELDAAHLHVDDRAVVQGHHRLVFADAPDVPDALLQVACRTAPVRVEEICNLIRGRDLPCAADTEADLVPDKIIREKGVR